MFCVHVQASTDNKMLVTFFKSDTCEHCQNIEKDLTDLEKEIPDFLDTVELRTYEISDSISRELITVYYEKYSVPENDQGYVPMVFFGNEYFSTDLEFKDRFLNLYNKYINSPEQYIKDVKSVDMDVDFSIENLSEHTDNEKEQTDITLPIIVLILSNVILLSFLFIFIFLNKKKN